jgi:hypothetical protein
MTEPADTSPEPSEAPLPDGAASRVTALEDRVGRLEDAVAALQDTRPLEERVFDRVLERIGDRPRAKATKRPAAPREEHVIAAERRTVAPPAPAPEPAPPPPEEPQPAQPPEPTPAPAPTMLPAWSLPALAPQRWLLFDFVGELVAMVQMFFDIRYRVAWTTRIVVVGLLALIFFSWLWLPLTWLPFVGWFLDKLVTLLLAFLVYKALSREARRYEQARARHGPAAPP